MFPHLDLDRVRAIRLEAAEAENGFAFAHAVPGAEAAEIAGGCALFAGPGSPMTHALGIGMNGVVTESEFDRLEHYFRSRQSACLIDLCPLADLSVIEQVVRRGYRIIEFNNLMVREVRLSELPPRLAVRRAGPEELPVWNRVVAQGFSGQEEPPAEFDVMLASTHAVSECYLADAAGAPAAGAAFSVRNNIALFYGDATLIRFRGRGLQSALIRARLCRASDLGCNLAMATVLPGSSSERNYRRAGFELAYMRVNIARD